jgi:translocation and assembly module TamB
MAVVPQPGPHRTPPGRPGRRLVAFALAGAGVVGLGAWGVDQALRHTYARLRPQLEASLGRNLGHPLQLGPYLGLGWGGLRVGASQLRPGVNDDSSAVLAGLSLTIDPLASLRQRLPVLHLSLRGVEVDLRRNARGQYWVLGAPDPSQPQPRLDLRLRLAEPARLRFHPAGGEWRLGGELALQPHRRALDGRFKLQPRLAAGQVEAGVSGNWGQGRWQLDLRSRQLPLASLAPLLQLPGQVQGRADGRVQLAIQPQRRDCRGSVATQQLSWQPPGSQADVLRLPALRLECSGDRLKIPATPWRWGQQAGTLALQLRDRGLAGWQLEPLDLRLGQSGLQLKGALQPAPRLEGQWQLQPGELQRWADLPNYLVGDGVRGTLKLGGSWRQLRLDLIARQPTNPLLGPWQAALVWADSRLRLSQLTSDHLQATGSLPLAVLPQRGLVSGELDLQLQLRRYPLQRLDPVLGTQLEGWLDASGTVRGPLAQLTPDFRLLLDQPAAGPLALAERWQGDWFGSAQGGGRLLMEALAPAPAGRLEMRLDRRWVPVAASLERAGGQLNLAGTPRLYRWQADRFPLDGLQLALGAKGRRQPLQGRLSGAGQLGLQPLAFQGRAELDRPVALGVWARRARLEGRYANRAYQLQGVLEPMGEGSLAVSWSGTWQGPFRARIQARQLGDDAIGQLVQAWPRWRGEQPPVQGAASDLGTLVIAQLGASVDAQLQALAEAHARLAMAQERRQQRLTPLERLADVGARVDGELRLAGPSLGQAQADLEAQAQLWQRQANQDIPLGTAPARLRFNGPLQLGGGSFALDGLPLALIGLLTPVPQELRGSLQARGRYRLRAGQPELSLALALDDAQLADTALSLERGQLELRDNQLELDLALRAAGASSSLDLAGVVPIDPAAEGLELRLSSRDDGLRFLSQLAQPALDWQKGSGDLQLLVRGSLQQPIANGFLRVRGGELAFIGQQVRELEAIVLFDFEELLLQELSAKVGERGLVSGQGRLPLLAPNPTAPGLQVNLAAVPFNLPRIRAVADGELQVGGSLLALEIGGELGIGRGSINVQPGRLEGDRSGPLVASTEELIESRWTFQQPLVLVGADVESDASEALRRGLPQVKAVGFDDLRLRLGPNLTVGVPNLASFGASGLLRINGRLDPSLTAQGVVRLEQGRLNLFTTTFSLDPEAPNVAVFTPSLGLIPFLDIALRTRVSDSLNVGNALGSGGSLSLAQLETTEAGSLNQLNLVKVFLSVSGPADRLADNLVLRSSPPLPEERLLALIGGNSLAGLTGAGAGAALATVLGQSLLSPVLGTLSDAFGQRLSFALYPAYVNPAVSSTAERRSGRVPPQLVLGAEIGLDVTERFNASVLAAPNRSDVPPQLNLNYKASELLNLQGSIDSQGAWQTQLQVFFRF